MIIQADLLRHEKDEFVKWKSQQPFLIASINFANSKIPDYIHVHVFSLFLCLFLEIAYELNLFQICLHFQNLILRLFSPLMEDWGKEESYKMRSEDMGTLDY